jgi:transposase
LEFKKLVVAAVVIGGLSCNEAGKQFGVAVSTAVGWVRRQRETSSIAPGKMGGHRIWVLERIKAGDFTLRGLAAELALKAALHLPLFRRGILGPLGNAVSR